MKNKKLLFIIPVIICILVIAYIGIFSSKNIFLKGIKTLCNNVEKSYSEILDSNILELSKTNPIMTETTIKPSIKISDAELNQQFSQISNYSLLMKTGFDPKQKELFYNISALEKTNPLLDINLYGKEKALYLQAKNIFDKYIKIPFEEYDELFETDNIDDLIYLKNSIKKSIFESFDSNDFKESSVDDELDGKKVKLNKINYQLNEKNIYKIINKVLNNIYKDNKSLEILSKYTEMDKEELKKEIKNSIDEIEKEKASDEKILDINIYYKGLLKDVVKYELLVEDQSVSYKLEYFKANKKEFVNFKQDKQNIIEIVTEKETSKKSNTSVKVANYELIINKNDTKYEYKLKGIEDMNVSGEFSTNEKIITKNKEYEYNSLFSMVLEKDGQSIKLGLDINSKIKIGEKLNIEIPNDAVEINELNQRQINTIYYNIQNLPFVSGLTNVGY